VLCRQVRLSAPPREGVGLVLLSQILGMAGVGGWVPSLEAALMLELGFPLNLGVVLAPGIGPNLVMPYLQLEALLHPCFLDLSVL
jgi:hypothetical protein